MLQMSARAPDNVGFHCYLRLGGGADSRTVVWRRDAGRIDYRPVQKR